MASYFSTSFLCVLLPLSVLAYAVMPRKARWFALLLASYVFLLILSKELIVFVWASTLSIYLLGLALGALYARRDVRLLHAPEKKDAKRKTRRRYKLKARGLLAMGVLINIGILVALKYVGFFASVLHDLGLESEVIDLQLGAPIGISFYTLMAVSYLVDVYRESIEPDVHLGHVALYLCYFPYLMEGPIVRYGAVAPSLWSGDSLRSKNLYAGTLRKLWGLAKKLIVADRLNILVTKVYEDFEAHDGGIIALAAILYTLQLYCDFSGTMDVALGMSRLFGISLPENFKQPFFSKTTSEFWQRWHITLGAWFKDYVYYPISLSKPCKSLAKRTRKRFGRMVGSTLVSMIALFCVWLANGLWHGAGTQYVLFGMYYFVLISLGGIVEPAVQRITCHWKISRTSTWYSAIRIVRTLVIIFVGELIFRANDAQAALNMLGGIAMRFSFSSLASGGALSLGLDAFDFWSVGVGFACVLVLDICKERGCKPWDYIVSRGALARWAIWILLLVVVIVFGAYGHGYVPVDPLYAQF